MCTCDVLLISSQSFKVLNFSFPNFYPLFLFIKVLVKQCSFFRMRMHEGVLRDIENQKKKRQLASEQEAGNSKEGFSLAKT